MTINIHLMQHAHSKPKEEGPERALTDEGKAAAQAVARLASKLDLGIERIYHSGKVRARQTAEILAEALSPRPNVETRQGLDPLDPVEPVADWLRKETSGGGKSLAVVGHLPFLDKLASLLVAGRQDAGVVAFRYAGLVKLVPKELSGFYAVEWILAPELARR